MTARMRVGHLWHGLWTCPMVVPLHQCRFQPETQPVFARIMSPEQSSRSVLLLANICSTLIDSSQVALSSIAALCETAGSSLPVGSAPSVPSVNQGLVPTLTSASNGTAANSTVPSNRPLQVTTSGSARTSRSAIVVIILVGTIVWGV